MANTLKRLILRKKATMLEKRTLHALVKADQTAGLNPHQCALKRHLVFNTVRRWYSGAECPGSGGTPAASVQPEVLAAIHLAVARGRSRNAWWKMDMHGKTAYPSDAIRRAWSLAVIANRHAGLAHRASVKKYDFLTRVECDWYANRLDSGDWMHVFVALERATGYFLASTLLKHTPRAVHYELRMAVDFFGRRPVYVFDRDRCLVSGGGWESAKVLPWVQTVRENGVKIAFCHPGQPNEKGGVESTNNLMRMAHGKLNVFSYGEAKKKVEDARQFILHRSRRRRPSRVVEWLDAVEAARDWPPSLPPGLDPAAARPLAALTGLARCDGEEPGTQTGQTTALACR